MERRPTRYKSTDTLLPDTTLFRSSAGSTLGELHLSGAFPGADPAAGIEYLQRAHQAGIASATAHLGQAYLEGRGVPKDPEKAIPMLKRAAEAGQPGAMKIGRASCRERVCQYV